MSKLLDLPGFVAAFVLAIVIVVPILIRTLKQQDGRLKIERAEREIASGADSMAAARCGSCGAVNRVPVTAERALCGACQAELVRTGAAPEVRTVV